MCRGKGGEEVVKVWRRDVTIRVAGGSARGATRPANQKVTPGSARPELGFGSWGVSARGRLGPGRRFGPGERFGSGGGGENDLARGGG